MHATIATLNAAAANPAMIRGNEPLPPMLHSIRVLKKRREGNAWVLTSRKGIEIGRFTSESAADRWCQQLRERQGRDTAPSGGRSGRTRPAIYAPNQLIFDSHLQPWCDKYDMPEFDAT